MNATPKPTFDVTVQMKHIASLENDLEALGVENAQLRARLERCTYCTWDQAFTNTARKRATSSKAEKDTNLYTALDKFGSEKLSDEDARAFCFILGAGFFATGFLSLVSATKLAIMGPFPLVPVSVIGTVVGAMLVALGIMCVAKASQA